MTTKTNAIALLKSQHREVEALFKTFEKVPGQAKKRRVFKEIADKLAVHAGIEEKHFYPGVNNETTADLLLGAVEQHVSAKRLIADLLDVDGSGETFEAKVKVLQEQIEHHVEEEEQELFPLVKETVDPEMLNALGQQMLATQLEMENVGSNPRDLIPRETTKTAPV